MKWYELASDTLENTCAMAVPGGVVMRELQWDDEGKAAVALCFIPGVRLKPTDASHAYIDPIPSYTTRRGLL